MRVLAKDAILTQLRLNIIPVVLFATMSKLEACVAKGVLSFVQVSSLSVVFDGCPRSLLIFILTKGSCLAVLIEHD